MPTQSPPPQHPFLPTLKIQRVAVPASSGAPGRQTAVMLVQPVSPQRVPMKRGGTRSPLLAVLVAGVLLYIVVRLVSSPVGTRPPVTAATRATAAAVTMRQTSSVPKRETSSALVSASKALVRLSVVDPTQYSSQEEKNLWWPSACSAGAMAEVINAYGHQYRITDILHVEENIGTITPQAGLLAPHGLDSTLAKFNFTTHWLYDPLALPPNPSVDELVTTANSGTPVIINFPPSRWSGGHVLVALGGNKDYVYLADTSKLNMRKMDRTTFLKYWIGFAVVATPTTNGVKHSPYSVVGPPSISADFINRVLAANSSPAAGKGQALYDLGVKYGIDPAFALAFYQHESSFGKSGEASTTLSLGNLRCIPDASCVNQSGQQCQAGQSCYASFPTWEAGFEAWYKLIRNLYVETWGLTTVDQIIPKYAPTADNNDEVAYIAALKRELDTWRAGNI